MSWLCSRGVIGEIFVSSCRLAAIIGFGLRWEPRCLGGNPGVLRIETPLNESEQRYQYQPA